MSFWDDIQKDLKESLSFFKEGSAVVTEKIEKLTKDGKKKYNVFNLNMKVQEEFAKLGGQIYDLIGEKSKNPLGNRKVSATIKRINKLEAQINKIEAKGKKKTKKTTAKKTRAKKTSKPKTSTAKQGEKS
jgi:hypothetical protein